MTAGITLTHQTPASAIASVSLDDRSPTTIWTELARAPAFQAAIERAIRVSAVGKTPNEFRNEFAERDLPLGFDELAVRIAKGDTNAAYRLARAIETLGSGRDSLDDVCNAISILEGDESRAPVIGLRLHPSFFESRSDHRRDICRLIAGLARACDVRLVGSGIDHQHLARKHRDQLPGVSEHCKTSSSELSPEAAAETAWDELDPGSREVSILRDLQSQSSETLSRHALRSDSTVSRSRISQCVSKLIELRVIVAFGGHGDQYIELVEAGRMYLDNLDREIGRQRRLGESVSEPGKSSKYSRVSTERDGGGEDTPTTAPTTYTDRRQHGSVVDVASMPRWRHVAATAAATEGDIALVDHPIEPSEELRQPYLSYDDDRVVVGGEYTNPMQWWVCVARALTDRRVFEDVLTPERLDGEVGHLSGLLTDDTRILRDARCLGWLKDRDAEAERYADALVDAGEELCALLREYGNGDDGYNSEFRTIITQEALGIAGTVAHLCDLAGVDLVREVRLPEFSRRFSAKRREHLLETLTTGATISSSHGHFAAYRQLVDSRSEKRAAAMNPSIPADDPTGNLIGSFVIVGEKLDSFEERLQTAADRVEVHEDAPEFDVRIGIERATSRSAIASAVHRALELKNVDATRVSISLFHALTKTPYDVAQAIWHGLSAETEPGTGRRDRGRGREIRLDEVRLALASLPSNRILPEMSSTTRQTTAALLTTATLLNRTELAEKAGVTTRSLRDHLPTLEAIGLVAITDQGIRFVLPFPTTDERRQDIIPGIVAGSVFEQPIDMTVDLIIALVDEEALDPDHSIGASYFSFDTMGALRDCDHLVPSLRWVEWLDLLDRLAGTDPPERSESGFAQMELKIGPPIEQTAVQEVAG